METVRLLRAGLLAEGFADTTLIGFAGAPFTVACYMVEGGGSKDFAAVRGMAYAQPALFQRLMDVLTDATIEYLSAQVAAGAEALMLLIPGPVSCRRHCFGSTASRPPPASSLPFAHDTRAFRSLDFPGWPA